jgi:hypothetical protein
LKKRMMKHRPKEQQAQQEAWTPEQAEQQQPLQLGPKPQREVEKQPKAEKYLERVAYNKSI